MPTFCAVVGCGNKGTKGFFRFPSINDNHKNVNELARNRRAKWVQALRRSDLTESKMKYERICFKHFVSGRPSKLQDVDNVDWVPSVKMGYCKRSSKDIAVDRREEDLTLTEAQKEQMVDFITVNPCLMQDNQIEYFAKQVYLNKWNQLTSLLNTVEGGSTKTPNGWQQTWTYMKSEIEAQVESQRSTKNLNFELSPLDSRIWALMNYYSTERQKKASTEPGGQAVGYLTQEGPETVEIKIEPEEDPEPGCSSAQQADDDDEFANDPSLFVKTEYEEPTTINKSCFVPRCKSTTTSTPDKIFVPVPQRPARIKWAKAAKIKDLKSKESKATLYCCQDHFDLENDAENLAEYKMYQQAGSPATLKLKDGVVPTKFPPRVKKPVVAEKKIKKLRKQMIQEPEDPSPPTSTEIETQTEMETQTEASSSTFTEIYIKQEPLDPDDDAPFTTIKQEPIDYEEITIEEHPIKIEPIDDDIEFQFEHHEHNYAHKLKGTVKQEDPLVKTRKFFSCGIQANLRPHHRSVGIQVTPLTKDSWTQTSSELCAGQFSYKCKCPEHIKASKIRKLQAKVTLGREYPHRRRKRPRTKF